MIVDLIKALKDENRSSYVIDEDFEAAEENVAQVHKQNL